MLSFGAEDRSTAMRQLINKAIAGEKIESAIKKYRVGIPFRKAAQMSGLDYWDFQAELDKRGIPISISLSFAKTRLKKG